MLRKGEGQEKPKPSLTCAPIFLGIIFPIHHLVVLHPWSVCCMVRELLISTILKDPLLFHLSQYVCFLENCGADGFVKTGRNGRIFHSGGRGMLRVGIYKKNILNIFSLPQMCQLFTDGELSDGFCCRTLL